MKRFMRKIEDAMAAAAYAEEGEHEHAREVLKGHKTVLLAISDSMFDRSAFTYALNICKRIDASLEILYVTPFERKGSGLKGFLSEVEREGFTFSLVMKKGCMKKAILDYTDERDEILFVVVGSKLELDIACKGGERSLSDAWKRLKCPLVVVTKNEIPSPA